MFILGIITARGGSKGIKDKNIKPLKGKPLIAYAIKNALNNPEVNDLIVSTDSLKIKECAEQHGAKINRLRPDFLSNDTAKSLDVIRYEVETYEQEKNKKIDAIILLQPTSPLRTDNDVKEAISIFQESNASSLISVCDASNTHPFVMYKEEQNRLTPLMGDKHGQRRQDFPNVYARNGAIYIACRDLIMEQNRLICDHPAFYVMPRERSINIDEPLDLKLAEFFMENHV